MNARRLRARLGRALLAILGAWLGVAGVPAAVAAQDVADQQAGAPDELDVRIGAQRHDDDRLEFVLQVRLPGEPWSERIEPALRFLPPGTEVGRWLVSSVVLVRISDSEGAYADGGGLELRITARPLEDGRVEFGMQLRLPGGGWSELLLPARRFFPAGTEVGRWLASSSLTVTFDAGTTPAEPPDSPGEVEEPPADGSGTGDTEDQPGAVEISEDLLDFDMIDVQTGETVNIRSIVDGQTPLLFWLWSPY